MVFLAWWNWCAEMNCSERCQKGIVIMCGINWPTCTMRNCRFCCFGLPKARMSSVASQRELLSDSFHAASCGGFFFIGRSQFGDASMILLYCDCSYVSEGLIISPLHWVLVIVMCANNENCVSIMSVMVSGNFLLVLLRRHFRIGATMWGCLLVCIWLMWLLWIPGSMVSFWGLWVGHLHKINVLPTEDSTGMEGRSSPTNTLSCLDSCGGSSS